VKRRVVDNSPWRRPWRWARNQAPTARATAPKIKSSWPTIKLGRETRARPPAAIAALVVMLPMTTFRGDQKAEAIPKINMTAPTQTIPFRLESLAANSRPLSFWAAPSSVLARVSSRSETRKGVMEWWSDGVVGEDEDENEEEDWELEARGRRSEVGKA